MKKVKNDSTKLIIFSDIHYAPVVLNKNFEGTQRKLTKYAPVLANKLIEVVNNIKPDAVISLGDLIQDAPTHVEDVENLKHIWSVFKQFKVPFFSISGNHDLLRIPRKEVSDIMGYDDHNFSKNIGAHHLIFLGLDVDNEKTNEVGGILKSRRLSNSTIKWLENDLSQNCLPTIIFIHYGVAEDDMKDNFWFSKHPEYALLENRKELKRILQNDKNVVAVFSGHQHWTKRLVENNIKYYVVGSLTENLNNDGVPDGVYFEVDIEDDKLTVTEHHLKI